MIHGVLRNGQPRVVLSVQGERTASDVEFVVDTGFTGFLSMPTGLLDRIGAVTEGVSIVSMADGSYRRVAIYRADVEWDALSREAVEILTLEDQPLLGFKMMQGYHLSIEMQEDGSVILEEM